VPLGPASFLAVAFVYLLHLEVSGDDRFHSDALEYWQLGELFDRDGHFSLLSYDSPHRGYSLPLFNHGLQGISAASGLGELGLVRLTGALLAATLGVVVLPRLARLLFPSAAIGWGRVLLFNALIFLFWRGHFGFPLSDFPALLAVSVGLIALLRGTTAAFVVAGIGFGLAANLRPAYLPAAIAALTAAALVPPPPRSWRRRGLALTLVLTGALLVSLPQMVINNHVRGTWSPLVPSAREIGLLKLTEGLRSQRYETWVETPDRYPDTKVYYRDPAGQRVLNEEDVSEITSFRQYAGIVLRHPDLMTGSYALHVVNGLDVWYPTPYVRDLEDRTVFLSWIQFTLVFVATARLFLPEARRRLGQISWIGVAVFVSPCLSAVPGGVEPRFFLPAHILVYMLVCFGPAAVHSYRAVGRRARAAIACAYVTVIALALTASVAARSQAEYSRTVLSAASHLIAHDTVEMLSSVSAGRQHRLSSDGRLRNS